MDEDSSVTRTTDQRLPSTHTPYCTNKTHSTLPQTYTSSLKVWYRRNGFNSTSNTFHRYQHGPAQPDQRAQKERGNQTYNRSTSRITTASPMGFPPRPHAASPVPQTPYCACWLDPSGDWILQLVHYTRGISTLAWPLHTAHEFSSRPGQPNTSRDAIHAPQ